MSVQALLHYEALGALYDADAAQQQTPLFDIFWSNPENLDSDEVKYRVNPLSREAAPFNYRGAPARVLDLKGMEERRAALFHVFNMIRFPNDLMLALTEPESDLLDKMSAREIRRQMDGFGRAHRLQKEVVTARMLFDGKVRLNQDGEVYESAYGGPPTDIQEIDFGLSATHQGTLDGLVTKMFDDPTADIQALFDAIDDKAGEEGVTPPTTIVASTAIRAKLKNNKAYKAWSQSNPDDAAAILRGGFIEGLFGKTWYFFNHHYKNKISNQTVPVVPSDRILMFAPTNTGWLRCYNGVENVPTKIGLGSTIDEILASVQQVYGPFAYASVNHNPISLEAFIGDNYGFGIAEPNAIWVPKVSS